MTDNTFADFKMCLKEIKELILNKACDRRHYWALVLVRYWSFSCLIMKSDKLQIDWLALFSYLLFLFIKFSVYNKH